jgi:hypothetical protein
MVEYGLSKAKEAEAGRPLGLKSTVSILENTVQEGS